jgi:hypothetical protein
MADDLVSALRSLANRWAMKARDFARSANDDSASESQAAYDKGFADGYYRAATELAAVIKEFESSAPPERPAAPQTRRPTGPQPRPTAAAGAAPQRPATTPPTPPPTAPAYKNISVGEALSVLEFAGCAARDITQNKDFSFRAIFSRWENMMPHERLERIQKADGRIVILDSGKLDNSDHFVEFAFKET